MVAMLHGRNNRFFFLWGKMFFLMQNIFIVPAMQHGCRAKPLLLTNSLKQSNVLFNSLKCHSLGDIFSHHAVVTFQLTGMPRSVQK